MFRQPPQTEYVVYSVHDPDLPEGADVARYQETLDHAHLGNVAGLTEIELHTPTVAQRCKLRGKISAIAVRAGVTDPDDNSPSARARYLERHWEICALKVRSALRRVGDERFKVSDCCGLAEESALDYLPGPEVVEEIAGYVDLIAHLPSLNGPSGGGEQSAGA